MLILTYSLRLRELNRGFIWSVFRYASFLVGDYCRFFEITFWCVLENSPASELGISGNAWGVPVDLISFLLTTSIGDVG
jgi:hypothetical protein